MSLLLDDVELGQTLKLLRVFLNARHLSSTPQQQIKSSTYLRWNATHWQISTDRRSVTNNVINTWRPTVYLAAPSCPWSRQAAWLPNTRWTRDLTLEWLFGPKD
eukprot:2486042-Prymnesium_polylepis.1